MCDSVRLLFFFLFIHDSTVPPPPPPGRARRALCVRPACVATCNGRRTSLSLLSNSIFLLLRKWLTN